MQAAEESSRQEIRVKQDALAAAEQLKLDLQGALHPLQKEVRLLLSWIPACLWSDLLL